MATHTYAVAAMKPVKQSIETLYLTSGLEQKLQITGADPEVIVILSSVAFVAYATLRLSEIAWTGACRIARTVWKAVSCFVRAIQRWIG